MAYFSSVVSIQVFICLLVLFLAYFQNAFGQITQLPATTASGSRPGVEVAAPPSTAAFPRPSAIQPAIPTTPSQVVQSQIPAVPSMAPRTASTAATPATATTSTASGRGRLTKRIKATVSRPKCSEFCRVQPTANKQTVLRIGKGRTG